MDPGLAFHGTTNMAVRYPQGIEAISAGEKKWPLAVGGLQAAISAWEAVTCPL